jgi:hypothetical protein
MHSWRRAPDRIGTRIQIMDPRLHAASTGGVSENNDVGVPLSAIL